MSTETQSNIPTGVSVAFALVTYFLFHAGYNNLAWGIIIIGGLTLGILLGRRSRK